MNVTSSSPPALARYAAPQLLAFGACSDVFRAQAVQTGRDVVVHILPADAQPTPGDFLQTLRTAAHLRHPGLVPILDFGCADGRGFWVTPYYPAGSLRRRLETSGPITAETAVRWIAGLSPALDYLRRRGLAPARLKPGQLFLIDDLQAPGGVRLLLDGAGLAPLWGRPDQATPDVPTVIHALLAELSGGPPPEATAAAPELRSGVVHHTGPPEPGSAACAPDGGKSHGTRETTDSPTEAASSMNAGAVVRAEDPATASAALSDTGPAAAIPLIWVDVIAPGQRTRAFPLPPGTTSIGRDPDNDVVFNQADVSRRHARIVIANGRARVSDLGSANGTFLDGQRLPADESRDWPPEAPLQIGGHVLRCRIPTKAGQPAAASPAPETPPRRRRPTSSALRQHAAPPRTLTILSSIGLVVGALVMAVAWPEMPGLVAPAAQHAGTAQTATALWFGADDDRDGLPNALEMTFGSLPLVPDSDGDGLTDGNEVRRGLDPIRPDSDGDRTPDPMDLAGGPAPASTSTLTPTAGAVVLAELEPKSVVAGEDAFKLIVAGDGFAEGAVVRWDGADRPTTFVDARTLAASIAAADVAAAGVVRVQVHLPGAGDSVALDFAVYNPTPVIYTGGLDPVRVEAGGPAFTLLVNGASFVEGAVVRWNGQDRPTVFRGPAQLAALITAEDIVRAGAASVAVFNPGPGGGLSMAQSVMIEASTPTLTGLSPGAGTAGGAAITVNVAGTGFQVNSVARWNGQDRPTTFVSGTQLILELSATDLAAAGAASVTVVNPRNGAVSNALRFSLYNPAPALDAITPLTVTAGSPGVVITVTGAAFRPGAALLWNGAPRPTTRLSETQITAAIPAADLAAPGPVVIAVNNPPPGGGTSPTSATLTLTAP